jgi:uncharacterized membrane protein (UPF0182 family)
MGSPAVASHYSQLQVIRTYYDFVDVDNDRYLIDGKSRQVSLSPRELSSNGCRAASGSTNT